MSSNTIRCIYQDRLGFIWIGTQDGLNRYAGYDFRIYRHDADDPGSLAHDSVRSVYVDQANALWVGTEGGLDRIAQEALNNVAKHAQADQVQVRFDCALRQAALSIRDNGRGFDPTEAPAGRLGLGIMRERAASISAQFEIESRPGQGTEITVVWAESIRKGQPDD